MAPELRGRIMVWSFVSTLSLGACGGDDQGQRGGDTAPADVAPDTSLADTAPIETSSADTGPADTSPPGERLTLQFLEALEGAPVPSVAVAWTPPGGARVEGTTDALGRITLEGIDWSKGALTLFGHLSGHAATGGVLTRSMVEDPDTYYTDDGALVLPMPPLAPAATITVTGQATGMVDVANNLVVACDQPGTPLSMSQGANFRLQLSSSAPFNWTAFEWFPNTREGGRNIDNSIVQWASGSQAGFDDDGEMSLDFATQSMSPKSATGTFPLFQSDTPSALLANGVARVSVFGNSIAGGIVGSVPWTTIDALASSVDYQVDWVEPEWASEPLTAFELSTASEISRVLVRGWPTAGSQDVALPVPAAWVTPATGASVADPLEWVNEAPEAMVRLLITYGTQAQPPAGVILHFPPGTTRVVLADVMGPFDPFAESGLSLLGAVLIGCDVDGEVSATACARFTLSRRIQLAP